MDNLPEDRIATADYYSLIKRYLKKQYAHLSEKELQILCRGVIFAPESYLLHFLDLSMYISDVRKNLANFIEREASAKNFIPYSLNAEIADLIEDNKSETLSVNEYYRWVSVVADIVAHTGDGVVTRDDEAERRMFVKMSYDREAELLLCIALYQGAKEGEHQDKIGLLMFKLEKLRELRDIVFNTSRAIASLKREGKEQLRQYYDYCQQLLKQNLRDISKFRLKLKLKKYDNMNEEDFEDDIFFLEYLRKVVLRMMRRRRMLALQSQQNDVQSNTPTPAEVVMTYNRDANSK